MTTDIAALVFNFAAAVAGGDAEKSRVFARRSPAGEPNRAQFMPDNCPISPVAGRFSTAGARSASEADDSPANFEREAQPRLRKRFASLSQRDGHAPRAAFERRFRITSHPPEETGYQS